MVNAHNGYHAAKPVMIGGCPVDVDLEIVDFVLWLNALPGVSTYTSCQGGGCSVDAFVHFTCPNAESVKSIEEFVQGFATVEEMRPGNYRLLFPNTETLRAFNKARFQRAD